MASSKLKIAAVGTGAVILAIGVGFLGVKTIHWVRAAHAPDIQGAWAGIFEAGQQKWPMMYKISRENGSYHAVEVNIYQGAGKCRSAGSFTIIPPSASNKRQSVLLTKPR
jgi:hypothetical protein